MTSTAQPFDVPSLPTPDPSGWRRLHLVGIGGAGMSGIAKLLLARGIEVSGSDLKASRGWDALRSMGADVAVGHRAEQVGHPDAVVISSAIRPDNPEVRAAAEAGIPVLLRAQVLAALMVGRRGVAVSGTHGKTTTTSMVSVMLSRLGLDPSFVIGGDLNESGSGAEHGQGDVFVAEADESDGSFLVLRPDVAVITNIEEDHLDFYGDRAAIERAFAAFAARSGTVVACWDDPGVRRALEGTSAPLIRYGEGEAADVRVSAVCADGVGVSADIDVAAEHRTVRLEVPGRHNALNAAAAVGVAHALGLPVSAAVRALETFSGVRRRFERRGTGRGATFVDDYAHHPTEIAATIAAARCVVADQSNGAGRPRVIGVFQPHRYTRTRAMWRELGESLAGADLAVVTDVYDAGEDPIPGVSGKLVVEALADAAPGRRIVYLPRRSEIAPFLAAEIRPGDLVLTLGAGDITMVGEETLSRIHASDG
ncbi:MAG TPA: UDP-N-acetylmuramate--L-alanine ligase [Actinomycetota bacterium]|nr:UDP-N-acetylmuramate--L-alanine ligase [Actinomycetota bacterium]